MGNMIGHWYSRICVGKFTRVLTLYRKYDKALTFENLSQDLTAEGDAKAPEAENGANRNLLWQ